MGVGILYAINKDFSLPIGELHPLNAMAFTTCIRYDAAYSKGILVNYLSRSHLFRHVTKNTALVTPHLDLR